MRVARIRAVEGPNIYHYRPVLVMRLHLDKLTERESNDVPGFVDRLLEKLPGLCEHRCSRGKPGGFVERLREGTYFGHVVEHVAIELSQQAGIGVNYGKTVYAGAPGMYDVAVRYVSEAGMRCLLHAAVACVDALVQGTPFPLQEKVEEARRRAEETALGPSTRALVEAAEQRGIPWMRLNDQSLIQLGYGRCRKFIQAAMSSSTSQIAVDIACDKQMTRRLLERAFIPVPQGCVVHSAEEAVEAAGKIKGAVVVKPVDGNQGRGVSVGLSKPEEIIRAFHLAREISPDVIVEEQFHGTDYRILVVNGKMAAASLRLPCHVTGDGTHTIAELIEQENKNPRRGQDHEKPLTRIEVDAAMQAYLEQTGRSLSDRPEAGTRIFLRRNANLSTGGTARDVTGHVHPDVRRLCERAARIIGLDICGIDLIVPDISRPVPPTGGGIIEINAAPGLRMHVSPSEGEARDVGMAVMDMLYPAGTSARVPIVSITGTNGKTTVTRLIAHVLSAGNCCVGMTTTDGVYIGGAEVARGDMTGPASARAVLADPSVEVAVLETARGGIARGGLGYDWSDVAVLTNIGADHIGQDGIECIDDLVHVKSLVAERVREGGTLVLNAEDEHLAEMMRMPRVRRLDRRVVYFAVDPDHERVRSHCRSGGTAFYVRDEWIVEARGEHEEPIVRVAGVPLTLEGSARFQVANVLAAAAACRACGTPPVTVAASLRTFESAAHNAGRANLYRLGKGYVLVDYGHNPDAFEAVCAVVRRWRAEKTVTGIIGVPGDRDDALIRQAGKVAAGGFDRVVVKEDRDRRGRRPGEVARLLAEAVRETHPGLPCRIVLDECQALQEELERVREGAVAVLFYEDKVSALEVLQAAGAVPASSIKSGLPAGIEGDGAPADPAGIEVADGRAARKTRVRQRMEGRESM